MHHRASPTLIRSLIFVTDVVHYRETAGSGPVAFKITHPKDGRCCCRRLRGWGTEAPGSLNHDKRCADLSLELRGTRGNIELRPFKITYKIAEIGKSIAFSFVPTKYCCLSLNVISHKTQGYYGRKYIIDVAYLLASDLNLSSTLIGKDQDYYIHERVFSTSTRGVRRKSK